MMMSMDAILNTLSRTQTGHCQFSVQILESFQTPIPEFSSALNFQNAEFDPNSSM